MFLKWLHSHEQHETEIIFLSWPDKKVACTPRSLKYTGSVRLSLGMILNFKRKH